MTRGVKLKAFPSFVVQIFIKSTFMRHSPKISFKSPSLCLQNFFEISSDFQFFSLTVKKIFFVNKKTLWNKMVNDSFSTVADIFSSEQDFSQPISARSEFRLLITETFIFKSEKNPEKKFQNRKSRKFEF